MTIEEILALGDFKLIVEKLAVETVAGRTPQIYRDEYEGKRERRESSVDNRPNKSITVYSETETDKDGNPAVTGTDTVSVAKIRTNVPKKIVRTATAFLFGGEMNVAFDKVDEATAYFKTTFADKLKMSSVFNQFARTVMIETKSALVFFPKTVVVDGKTEVQVGVRVLSVANGEFYPHFDNYGDMDAFMRKYKALDETGVERDYIWIQTADKEITTVDIGGVYATTEQPNLSKKITVVYAEQNEPEWEDITTSMDALEMRLSRLVDTNDYFSEPILKSFGQSALPSKNTVGKELEFSLEVDPDTGKTYHGDAEYLVWQQSIESTKLEIDEHKNVIFSGTSTPDLSFENLKGINNISGIGMKFMFLDAFIKAAEKREIFGPAVQRSVSVVKAMISNVAQTKFANALKDNAIKVTFRSILPDDLKELVEVLVKANGDKPLNSQETITAQSPFTTDTAEEMKKLQDEAAAESGRNSLIGNTL